MAMRSSAYIVGNSFLAQAIHVGSVESCLKCVHDPMLVTGGAV